MATITDLTQYNMEDVQDPSAVEAGEYKIRLIDLGEGVKEDKNGNPFLMPRFEICDEPLAKDFSKYLPLPTEDMDGKKLQKSLADLKNFCLALGVTFEILNACIASNDFGDLLGLEAWALLGIDKEEGEYGKQNYVKKWVTGA